MVRHSHTSSHSSSSSSSSHGSTTHHGGNSGGDGSSGSSGGSGGANPGGSGKGYGLHTDSLGTMEGNIGRTRDKVDGVGRTVGSANFGAQTMGVVGSGMTGTLNNALQGAQSQVAKATTAVENAGHQTKATRTAYETTEQSSANALKGFKSDGNGSTKPSGTGTSPSSAGGSGSGSGGSGGSGSGGSGSGGSGDSGGSGSGGTPPSGGGGPNSPGHRGGQNTPGEHWQDTVRKNFSDKDYADFQRAMDKMSQDPKPGEVPGSGQLTQREKDLTARAMNLVQVDKDTLMQKVIPPDAVHGYLGDLRSDGSFEGGNYKDIRGFVARNQDAGVFTRPDDIVSGNRLDYPNSPYHQGMSHVHTMEFPARDTDNYRTPVGAPSVPGDMAGKNPMVQHHADEMNAAAERAGVPPATYERSITSWPYSGGRGDRAPERGAGVPHAGPDGDSVRDDHQ